VSTIPVEILNAERSIPKPVWTHCGQAQPCPAKGCKCGASAPKVDEQHQLVIALTEAGMELREASLLVYAPEYLAVRNVRAFVRAQFAVAFPWLRLPEEEVA
jgi:hypothetical protein